MSLLDLEVQSDCLVILGKLAVQFERKINIPGSQRGAELADHGSHTFPTIIKSIKCSSGQLLVMSREVGAVAY